MIVYLIADFSDRIDDFLSTSAHRGDRPLLPGEDPADPDECCRSPCLPRMLLSLGGFSRNND